MRNDNGKRANRTDEDKVMIANPTLPPNIWTTNEKAMPVKSTKDTHKSVTVDSPVFSYSVAA